MKKIITSTSILLAIFLSGQVFVTAEETDIVSESEISMCTVLTKAMNLGSRDIRTEGQVTDLQIFLQTRGYLESDPTGYFGAMTLSAVRSFQRANGITPNGNVGPATRAKIKALSCSTTSATTQPTESVSYQTSGVATLYVSNTTETAVTLTYANMPTNTQLVFINKASGERVNEISATLNSSSGMHSLNFVSSMSGTYYIKAINYNTGKFIAESGAFTVFPQKTGTLISPNGGENIAADQPFVVRIKPVPGKTISLNLVTMSGETYGMSINGTYYAIGSSADTQTIIPTLPSDWMRTRGTQYKVEMCTNNVCDTSDGYFTISSVQASLGRYEGYLNEALFISTASISREEALANCKTNNSNNPTKSIRCTWNGTEIYSSSYVPPTATSSPSVTLATPVLVSSSPVSQYVLGGTTFGIATFKIATAVPGTSSTVRELRFITTGVDAIESVTVGGVTAAVVGGGVTTVTGLNISINSSGTDIPVTVKFAGFQNSTTGGSLATSVPSVSLTLNYIEATNGSGFIVTKTTPVSSNMFTLVASKPTLTVSSGGVDTLKFGSESKIGEFTVSADANGKIVLESASLEINSVGISNFSVSSLRVANGATTIAGSATTISSANKYIAVYFNSPYEISPGQSTTFSIYGVISGSQTNSSVIPYVITTMFSPQSFVWKDYVGGGTRQTGDKIYNFPTNGFTTNRNVVAAPPVAVTTNGPKKNLMSCTNPKSYGLAQGQEACYGIWDYGDEFGNDQNMCPPNGYSGGTTGCKVTTPACQSGQAVATRLIPVNSLSQNSSDIETLARTLGSTKEAVKAQLISVWVYTCDAATTSGQSDSYGEGNGNDYDYSSGGGAYLGATSQVLGVSTSATCVDISANLHRGDETSNTFKLQSFLNKTGLLVVAPSGFYGDQTIEAVKKYQAKKGLPVTGMVYDFTRQAIKAETCAFF